MFTCSSCGYEANPDSSPACSLCGTKKPGASSTNVGSKPAKVSDDELANAAKLVAETASDAPVTAKASAKGKGKGPSAGGTAVAVETSTGVLRLRKEPADLHNSVSMLGALVGAIAAYVVCWHHNGHAPDNFMDALWPIGGALVLGAIARFAFTGIFEQNLTPDGRESFAGPGAALVGAGFLVFSIFAFIAGGRTANGPTPVTTASGAVGADGMKLAEHMALLTNWAYKLKADKFVALVKDKTELRIPLGSLAEADVAEIQRVSGLAANDIQRLASDDPYPGTMRLPDGFSIDAMIDHMHDAWGVQRDRESKPIPGKIRLLRRRLNGAPDEALTVAEAVSAASDISSALPAGVKLWIGVGMGAPHPNTSADHEAFVAALYDKYGPQQ
ncbi:MAG TPA: hypothetical protein VFF73_30035 [Planctomycetota bacterium]|nr:hypothetical protein [Planctomycetota bacterium]